MNTEHAKAEDLPNLLDFLYAVFNGDYPGHQRFELMYPDVFLETGETADRHIIIRNNGRIVACVGTYPINVKLAGCKIRVFGLGNVSTAADMRGRGFMSELLRKSIDRMKEEGASLSWLGGRHDRYSRFGWEAVPGDTVFSLQGSLIRKISDEFVVSQAPGKEAEIDDEMTRLREAGGIVEDSAARYSLRVGRIGREVWTARSRTDGRVAAWAVIEPGARFAEDYYGSTDGILHIARSMAIKNGSVNVPVCAAAYPALSEKLRCECAQMYYETNMVSVISLRGVIEDYMPLIKRRLPKNCGFTLKMDLPGGISEEVQIGEGEGAVIELDRKRMARLLFGCEREAYEIPGVPAYVPGLRDVFPLPFSLPRLFHV